MFKLFAVSLATLAAGLFLFIGQAAAAAPAGTQVIDNALCAGANFDVNSNCQNIKSGNGDTVNKLIRQIINILSFIVGFVAVIMIIVGGFRYITSGGNDTNVTGAKNTILYAIIGLIIVALSQIIVHFVIKRVSSP